MQTLTAPHKLQAFALIIRATHSTNRDDQRAVLSEMFRRGLWLGDGENGDDQQAMAIRAAGLAVPELKGDRAALLKAMGYARSPVPIEARSALPVIFRAERSGDFKGDVTAVFPTLPGTSDPWTCTAYAHVGQHSICNREWYATTRAATPDEYADLLAELRGIYERDDDADAVRLEVVQRWTRHLDDARRAELTRMGRVAA